MTSLQKFEKAYEVNDLETIKQIINKEFSYNLFAYACASEYIDVIKLMYSLQKVPSIKAYEFVNTCIYGKLNTLKCLHELYTIPKAYYLTLFSVACDSGHLEIAKWISELSDFDYNYFNLGLDMAKLYDRKNVINWILTTYPLCDI